MDFETAQMEKSAVTENAGCGNGGGLGGGDDGGGSRPPPPFLTKTYEMVDDLGTNSIISWNSTGTGFIIWDHIKFSAEILPRLFRSNNFSSFIYQLNNYGFKKISWERYEYANPWFQPGKKHWLKNMKRRNQQPQVTNKRGRFTPDHNPTNARTATKINAMITEQNDMKCEIQKLRQNLDNMENQLASFQTNTLLPEIKDDKMDIQDVLKQFMQYLRKKKDDSTVDSSKRPRLDSPSSTEHSVDLEDNVEIPKQKLSVSADDSRSSIQDQKVSKTRENAENCQFWKNMLVDLAGGRGDLAAHHSKAVVELDEMMAMQRETLIAKIFDSDVEDDGQLELWT